MQDPENRVNVVPFTPAEQTHSHGRRQDSGRRGQGRGQNTNPKDAIIDLEWLAPPIKLMEAHDQLGGNGGAFCYIYV